METEFSAHEEVEEDDILIFGLEIIEGWLEPTSFQHRFRRSCTAPASRCSLSRPLPSAGLGCTRSGACSATRRARRQRAGWDREADGEDGLTRSHAPIAPEPVGRRVGVLYKTAGLAEQGRAWFDALAGDSVKFQLQEVSDPKGLLARADRLAPEETAAAAMPAGLDPETAAGVIESYILRNYANWADEPIPALNGQTPRHAVQSAAGLERVKGLLRSYEDGEARQAAQQGRRVVSYQFLWDALDLKG